jgi:hypothetical protein
MQLGRTLKQMFCLGHNKPIQVLLYSIATNNFVKIFTFAQDIMPLKAMPQQNQFTLTMHEISYLQHGKAKTLLPMKGNNFVNHFFMCQKIHALTML